MAADFKAGDKVTLVFAPDPTSDVQSFTGYTCTLSLASPGKTQRGLACTNAGDGSTTSYTTSQTDIPVGGPVTAEVVLTNSGGAYVTSFQVHYTAEGRI